MRGVYNSVGEGGGRGGGERVGEAQVSCKQCRIVSVGFQHSRGSLGTQVAGCGRARKQRRRHKKQSTRPRLSCKCVPKLTA